MSTIDAQEFTTFDGEGGRDDYQRKPVAEKVIQLLTSDIDISPLVIDGRWGAGKTEFCLKTINLLKDTQSGYQPVYVDAFKSDHTDEPLLMLIAEVVKLIPPETDKDEWVKKALPALRFGTKVFAKAAVGWVLRQDAADIVDGFDKNIESATDGIINSTVDSALQDHVDAEANINLLKGAIAEVAKDKNIIFFVDELDRCRPDYSTSLLETIKHIFDVPGVQFVLVANLEQLRASVNHCYGDKLDSKKYLDKFIKYTLSLPALYGIEAQNYKVSSVEHARDLLSGNPSLLHPGNFDLIENLIIKNNISLREVETLCRYIDIYNLLAEGDWMSNEVPYGIKLLIIFAIYVFCLHPDVTYSIEKGTVFYEDLEDLVDVDNIFRLANNKYLKGAELISAAAFVSIDSARRRSTQNYVSVNSQKLKDNVQRAFNGCFDYKEELIMNTVSRVFDVLRFSI